MESISLFWLFGLCLTLPAIPQSDDSLTSTVLGLQNRYAAVKGLTADFRQNYRGPGVDQTESGRLWMKKPGLMRWEYKVPEEKLFIADGRDTYLYTPADRQVLVQSFSAEDLHNTPLRFLLGQGEILKSFTASWESEFSPKLAGTRIFRLTPLASEAEYTFLVLECDATNHDLRRLIIREPTGNTSEFYFANIVTDAKLDKGQFQFKAPKGTEVIRLDEK
jgi:outer membrane lipoprotein carrier protein